MADCRIYLQPLSATAHPTREVTVGWDDVLQTYFARVIDEHDDGEEIYIVDRGLDIGEVSHPGDAINAVRAHSEIPDSLEELLAAGRASARAVITDLRPESSTFVRDTSTTEMYEPGGVVTALERNTVAPVIADTGWQLDTVHSMDGGHTEIYTRHDQHLEVRWGWPTDEHDSPVVLSPVVVDGHRFAVDSANTLASLLAEGTPDSRTQTPSSQDKIDELLESILGAPLSAADTVDSGEDPPTEDDGLHTGLGY